MYQKSKEAAPQIPIPTDICKDHFVLEEVKRLSKEQRSAIQETFKYLDSKPLESGHSIFVRLFSDFPEYKEIWPQFRGIPDSAIISADAVKRHGFVYMGGLKTIVDNIEHEEKLAEMISRIAISHLKWNIRKQHVMNMIPEVITVLRSCLQRQDDFVEQSWYTLYDVIGNLLDKFKAIQFEKAKKEWKPGGERSYKTL